METQFSVEDVICKPGKISNNLEQHGDEEVVVFAIPITGAMVSEATANAIAGDPHFTRSVFNDNKGFLEPMPWVRAPIRVPDKYEGAIATIKLQGDEVLEFEDARIKDIELSPQPGGLTQLDFQLQVKPDFDRSNLLLQEYQHREVTISIADAKIALKKTSKQRNLELVGGGEGSRDQDSGVSEDNYDHSEAERIAEANETERQLGEDLRGLEAQPTAA